jgi:hypothetical protein
MGIALLYRDTLIFTEEVSNKVNVSCELDRMMKEGNSLKKNGVFWVVTPCGSCKNRRFGGTWRLLHQSTGNSLVPPTLFMAVAGLKNAVFWDVMPCGSCKN